MSGAPVRVAILASFTAEPLVTLIQEGLRRARFDAELRLGSFNQIVQQCVDPSSEVAGFRPDILIVFPRFEELWAGSATRSDASFEPFTLEPRRVVDAVLAAAAWPTRIVFVLPCAPEAARLGLSDQRQPSLDESAREARMMFRKALGGDPRFSVIDAAPLIRSLGALAHDDALFTLARVPYSEACLSLLAREITSAFLVAVDALVAGNGAHSPSADQTPPAQTGLTLEGYLAGLALDVSIFPMSPGDERVVSDLSRIVADFHLDGRVRTAEEIQRQSAQGTSFHLVRVRDRFGDHGVSGAFALERTGDGVTVDLFLLSCPVLGKGVERRVVAEMARLARKEGALALSLRSHPSARNKESRAFVRSLGVAPSSSTAPELLIARIPLDGETDLLPARRARPPASASLASASSSSSTIVSQSTDPMRWASFLRERLTRRGAVLSSGGPPGATGRELLERMKSARAQGRTKQSRQSRQSRHLAAGPSPSLPPREPRNAIESALVRIWAETLSLPTVGIDDDFFELGGHSLLAVRLLSRVNGTLGRRLPLSSILQFPTVALFAEALGQTAATSTSCLIPLRSGGDRAPLTLVHPAAGNIFLYRHLARFLPSDQPVWGLEARGLDGNEPPLERVEEMAAHFVRLLRQRWPSGPYVLGGLSFGALVAFEMARQLEADSRAVPLLIVLDASAPPARREGPTSRRDEIGDSGRDDRAVALAEIVSALGHVFGRDLGTSAEGLRALAPDEQLDEVLNRLAPLGFLSKGAGRVEAEGLLRVYQATHRAYASYEPAGATSAQIVLVNAREQLPSSIAPLPRAGAGAEGPARGWDRVCANVDVHSVPGDHLTMTSEAHAPGLAQLLDRLLRRYAPDTPQAPAISHAIPTDEEGVR